MTPTIRTLRQGKLASIVGGNVSSDTVGPDSPGCQPSPGSPGLSFRVEPASAYAVIDTVEALGWGVLEPHANLAASSDATIALFESAGADAAIATDAFRAVWNRVLARNLARAEGTTNLMISAGREALGYLQQAQCDMATDAIARMDDADFNVQDGQ